MKTYFRPAAPGCDLPVQLDRNAIAFQLHAFNQLRDRSPIRTFPGFAIYDHRHVSSVSERLAAHRCSPSNLSRCISFYLEMVTTKVSSLPVRRPESGNITVVIETPKGSRNKFKYDEKEGVFKLSSVLPAGSSFPYDFGFIPSTKAADGDPLDVLLLMDEAAFAGCVIEARLIGVIEAEQTERGKTTRNDRLIAVAAQSKDYSNLESLRDVNDHLIDEIQHFFEYYNESRGTEFKVLGIHGPKR